MRVSMLPAGAALLLAGLITGCASTGDPTPASEGTSTITSTATAVAVAPEPTPRPTPKPTVEPTPAPAQLPSPEPMAMLWEAHGPVTDKTSTTYIAINPTDGNIWVGIPFENRFWIISPDGTYLESWGEGGKGPGQFDFSDHAQKPDGFTPIAFAPDGSFVIGDTGNNRVQLFDPQRKFIREWGSFGTDDGEFVQIVSIATDGTTVYVGDGDHYNIQAFDMNGTYQRTIGEEGGFSSVAIGTDGRIVATNTSNLANNLPALAIFDPDGSQVSVTVLPVSSADALQPVIDAAGNVYVSLEQDTYPWTPKGVVQFDPDGHVVRMFEGGSDFNGVSPDGSTLYAARGIQLDSTQWEFVRAFALTGQ